MTNTMKMLIEELSQVPEEEQEKYAASFLQDLRRRKQQKEEGQVEPYASFQVLKEAKFEGQPDESTTYEDALYGLNDDDE